MKTIIAKSVDTTGSATAEKTLRSKIASNKLFMYALELVILYVLVFAAMSAFAQEPATASKEAGKLEFVKENIVYNSGKVYMNWVAKPSSDDCIYVIERSTDAVEYEPVGLKEGIGSPLELLYSWVDTKPVAGVAHYRIKQIDNEGKLVAQAEPKSVISPDASPLFIDKTSRMVQVK
ncbi:MAG: hypothetical protein IPP51_13735 [Bacteroidetes bacterium]|nr:hypothetical protein [Bacteroidota bacterium]